MSETMPDLDNFVFKTKEEAKSILKIMKSVIRLYETVSLEDLHDLLGLPSTYLDHFWGWKDLNKAKIRQVREGYLIEFPSLEEI